MGVNHMAKDFRLCRRAFEGQFGSGRRPVNLRDVFKIDLLCGRHSIVSTEVCQYGELWISESSTYYPPFVNVSFAKSSRSPGSVLSGGTSPVLSLQKNISLIKSPLKSISTLGIETFGVRHMKGKI